MKKRLVIFAIATPAVVWLGMVLAGSKPDAAGTSVWSGPGLLLPSSVPHGLLIETVAAGVLAGYLTR